MSDKIRKYVLPNLSYLFVFWFFSKIGTAYRIAPGTDFGTKLMGMLDTFPKAFETYWPGLGGIDLLVGLAGAAGVYLLIQSKIRQAKKFRRDAEYGTARFGTKEDIPNQLSGQEGTKVLLTTSDIKGTPDGLAASVCNRYDANLVALDVSVFAVEKAIKEVARE